MHRPVPALTTLTWRMNHWGSKVYFYITLLKEIKSCLKSNHSVFCWNFKYEATLNNSFDWKRQLLLLLLLELECWNWWINTPSKLHHFWFWKQIRHLHGLFIGQILCHQKQKVLFNTRPLHIGERITGISIMIAEC